LSRTIPLPGGEGRIDHFGLDTAGERLFVAALVTAQKLAVRFLGRFMIILIFV